jgi:hypothetical protein
MSNIAQSAHGSDPAYYAASISPSNDTDLTNPVRAIYIGGAGAVVITTVAGTDVTFSGLPAGMILPVRAKRVKAAGTTATGLVGLW